LGTPPLAESYNVGLLGHIPQRSALARAREALGDEGSNVLAYSETKKRFVVLLGEFPSDTTRAKLLQISYFQFSKDSPFTIRANFEPNHARSYARLSNDSLGFVVLVATGAMR
jgi:hypothetical protein